LRILHAGDGFRLEELAIVRQRLGGRKNWTSLASQREKLSCPRGAEIDFLVGDRRMGLPSGRW